MAPSILIGSDCAGMDPIQWVLDDLQVPFKMQFVAEVGKACQRFQALVHKQKPVDFDADITKRTMVKHCHFYIAGFPVELGRVGSRQGPKGRRGMRLIKHVVRTIQESKPVAFLLETRPGKLFTKSVKALLRQLRSVGGGRY